jgi:hypothetical protein
MQRTISAGVIAAALSTTPLVAQDVTQRPAPRVIDPVELSGPPKKPLVVP